MQAGLVRILFSAAAMAAGAAQASDLGLPSYLGSPYDATPNPVLGTAIRQSGTCACRAQARESAKRAEADQGPSDWQIAHDTAEARYSLPFNVEDQRRTRAELVQVPP